MRRREPLTRERILEAARALADAEGLDAVTMRRLAAELGVEAMSLYHHVANKDALLIEGGFSYALAHKALHALGSMPLGFVQELFSPAATGGSLDVDADRRAPGGIARILRCRGRAWSESPA